MDSVLTVILFHTLAWLMMVSGLIVVARFSNDADRFADPQFGGLLLMVGFLLWLLVLVGAVEYGL